MSHRATIHFEKEAFALLKANEEEAGGAAYLQELADWDETLSDGLDA